MKIHELDILPEYYQPVLDGIKNFEIRRKRDHNFQIGDKLLLKEYLPHLDMYSDREVEREIIYITDYAQKDDYVILGLK